MDFRDGLSTDLPSPRDDEPASLRDDIMDELADHLACMYRRELLRGADASSAKAPVLERFGDPAAVARRLWFDAMKGKIMSQRILVSCCVFLTLLSLTLAGFMMVQLEHSRRTAAMMLARESEQARAAHSAQEQMLKQLAVLSKAVENPRSPDWIPVSFKLTQETLDGPPASGIQFSLGRGTGGSNRPESIRRQSDAGGLVDFGVIQPGDWGYSLHLPGSTSRPSWMATGTLNVLPGTKIEKTIVCPGTPAAEAAVSLRVEWPADLANRQLLAEASFAHEGLSYQPPLRWTSGGFWWNLLCGPDKNESRKVGWATLWSLSPSGRRVVASSPIYVDLAELGSTDTGKPAASVAMEPGSYRLKDLRILKPSTLARDPAKGLRFELVASPAQKGFTGSISLYARGSPDEGQDGLFGQIGLEPTVLSEASREQWSERFEARLGQRNEWRIKLPDELINAVRVRLKSGADATKE